MKLLLLFLLSVNVVIFIVQIKGLGGHIRNVQYVEVVGAKKIELLGGSSAGVLSGGRCIVIGELDDQYALTELSSFLGDQGVEFELIEKKQELAPSYWVFAKGKASEELSLKLSEAGMDSYVVSEGEWVGKVSLGLFANIDLAQDLINVLEVRDIEATYVERKKHKSSKWLSFKLSKPSEKSALLVGIKALEINVGEIKEIFCKSIASEK